MTDKRAGCIRDGIRCYCEPAEGCSRPNACDDEPCDKHEREQAHAEGEHAFCGPDCGQADERRERYAAPLFEIMRDNGWDGERTGQVNREMFAVADAAMAVADAEAARIMQDSARIAQLWLKSQSENTRLRAELDGMREAAMESQNGLHEALATLARLRADLDAADLSDRETGLYMDIRAALGAAEGEQ